MSFLSWFSSRKPPELQHSVMPSSGLSRLESTKPFNAAGHAATAQPANRKQERLARRELLYAVVREAMVRAGVLSSTYKFKVLSLDARGRTFLVMVDLSQGSGSDTNRLAEIEAMIAQSAKARYDIVISAVYWRANEHVAVGDPAQRAAQRPLVSQPAPLMAASGPSSRPAPLMAQAPRPAPAPRIDPLHPSEIAAFQQALAKGSAAPTAELRGEQALDAAGRTGSYTLLTGFEDTEMVDGSDAVGDHLSGTQFGALR
jgi:hypothetical protein